MNMSKNDARVQILNNKIELVATQIEAIVTPEQCDVILDRLFTITRPLRQNSGVCRVAFDRINKYINNNSVEKIIMSQMEA